MWKFGFTFHTTKFVSTLQWFSLFLLHINIDSFLKFNVTLNVTLLWHQYNTTLKQKTENLWAYYDLNMSEITITIVNLWSVMTIENDKNSCEIFLKPFSLLPTDCSTLQTASEIKYFRICMPTETAHLFWNLHAPKRVNAHFFIMSVNFPFKQYIINL